MGSQLTDEPYAGSDLTVTVWTWQQSLVQVLQHDNMTHQGWIHNSRKNVGRTADNGIYVHEFLFPLYGLQGSPKKGWCPNPRNLPHPSPIRWPRWSRQCRLYSLYSTATQNYWRWVLLRHLTQEIPTCWYLLRWVTQIFRGS